MADPYVTLGVKKTATAEEIRRAYRKLAKDLHPDARPGDKAAEERFKRVSQAFRLLSDPDRRARFDRGEIDADGNERPVFHHRHPGRRPGPDGRYEDLGDIFSDLFADMGQRGRRARPRKGPDIRAVLTLDFIEAARGGAKRVTLPGGRTVELKVPPGVTDGQVLRLAGQGAAGGSGAAPGDLLAEVRIAPHKRFSREGADVRLDLPVSLKEAVFGAKVRAPTIEGPVDVRIPPGSNSGVLLRLRGRGIAGPDGRRGDQIIRLVVDLPADDAGLRAALDRWEPPKGYDPRKGM